MSTSPYKSLSQVFSDLRRANRIGVFPFIPAGYPDLETTRLILPELEKAGSSAVEIGIPFSDPIADGPVIQAAFTEALSKKLKLADVFATIRAARPAVSIPLIAMVSHSIVFRYGPARFFADAKSAGFDAMIIPDLPPPEAKAVCEQVRSAGLDTILLISPTTSPERRKVIAELSSGFIYYLSVSGITGERDKLPADLQSNMKQLREISKVPVCVGFGISRPDHVKQLIGHADGAIVGSGLVRRMSQHLAEGPAAIAKAAGAYCAELASIK